MERKREEWGPGRRQKSDGEIQFVHLKKAQGHLQAVDRPEFPSAVTKQHPGPLPPLSQLCEREISYI